MQTLITLLMAADVFVALIIIALVLVQQSKEGALGSSFGGVGETVFGAHTGGHLAKLTIIFSVLFLSITLALAIIIGHRAQPRDIVDRELAVKEAPAKAAEDVKTATDEGKVEAGKLVDEAAAGVEKAAVPEAPKTEPAVPPAQPAEKK
jgi:preprotein translocase subunit SecG